MAPPKKTSTPATKTPATKTAAAPKKVAAPKKTEASPKPVVVPEVQKAPAEETPIEEENKSIEQELLETSAALFTKLQQMGSAIVTMKTEFRALEKRWVRELKAAQKSSKTKRPPSNNPPSGFAKAGPISDELAEFIGVEKGTEIARVDVTKLITKYVKENNLQGEKDGREIYPDDKLKKLLDYDPSKSTKQLGYFNIQKYMCRHFPKKEKVDATA